MTRGQSGPPQKASRVQPIRGLLPQLPELSRGVSVFHYQVFSLRLPQLPLTSCPGKNAGLRLCSLPSLCIQTMTKSFPAHSWVSLISHLSAHTVSPSGQASTASPAMCPKQPLPPSSPAQGALHIALWCLLKGRSGHINSSAASPGSWTKAKPRSSLQDPVKCSPCWAFPPPHDHTPAHRPHSSHKPTTSRPCNNLLSL